MSLVALSNGESRHLGRHGAGSRANHLLDVHAQPDQSKPAPVQRHRRDLGYRHRQPLHSGVSMMDTQQISAILRQVLAIAGIVMGVLTASITSLHLPTAVSSHPGHSRIGDPGRFIEDTTYLTRQRVRPSRPPPRSNSCARRRGLSICSPPSGVLVLVAMARASQDVGQEQEPERRHRLAVGVLLRQALQPAADADSGVEGLDDDGR